MSKTGGLVHQVRNPTRPNRPFERALRPTPTVLTVIPGRVVMGGRIVPMPLPALKRVLPTPDTIFFATEVMTCGDLLLTS